ncbi:efflux RND transporter periplasmic adaptor subunit [Herbiconiux sp. P18]|uniref:efflux RND transporter periplasmic adaptor subunit n=1 Tax=Herbiconiux liangxiaofengii TaxID=3342795 RepID=UPI0035B6FD43
MKIVEKVKRMRVRTWIVAGAALLLVAGGGTAWAVVSAQGSQAAETAPVAQNVAASLETLEKTVSASGTLSPTVNEDVDFEVAGTVTAVNVTAGSTVAAGDVLATVDTLTVQAAALEAQAVLAKAEATLASAEADDDGTDASATQIAADEAAVAVAQEDADAAAADVAKATLVAPVAGLVTSVNLAVGDTVTGAASGGTSGGSTSTGGATSGATSGTTTASTAAFTIVGTDAWQVAVTVGETDVANVAVGDQVELSTDDGTAFFGTVSEVGLLPSTTSGAAAYPVTVAVTGSPEGLHDGVSVTASIVYERRTDVLTVPSAAVTTDADGTSTVTVVSDDGTETPTTVTVGETSGTLVEITAGLAEGDLVKVQLFQGGSGNAGTGGTGQTGQLPGGGQLPEGFDPSQFDPSQFGGGAGTGTGGTGGFPGGTTGGN